MSDIWGVSEYTSDQMTFNQHYVKMEWFQGFKSAEIRITKLWHHDSEFCTHSVYLSVWIYNIILSIQGVSKKIKTTDIFSKLGN